MGREGGRISINSNESGWGRQASFPRNREGKATGARAHVGLTQQQRVITRGVSVTKWEVTSKRQKTLCQGRRGPSVTRWKPLFTGKGEPGNVEEGEAWERVESQASRGHWRPALLGHAGGWGKGRRRERLHSAAE